MKVLVDECVDGRLAAHIGGHEVKTVPQRGWANVADGRLLLLAQDEFDVLVTIDRNLRFQQHLPKYRIAVVVLCAKTNRLADLLPLVPKLLETLPVAPQGAATLVGE